MTDAEKIELLRAKLEETVDENDRLKALVANLTEGATAHQTLQSLYRNADLPESLRAKCAAASLPHETPRLEPVQQLELKAEPPPIPLAELVALRRKRADEMLATRREIRVLPSGKVIELDEPDGGNGSDDSDDDGDRA